jgi:hypothetical protein
MRASGSWAQAGQRKPAGACRFATTGTLYRYSTGSDAWTVLITLFSYVLVGMFLTMAALRWNLAVETPLIATSAYTVEAGADGGQARRAFVLANGLQAASRELACSDISALPSDGFIYAMDTVLPFIPLHQETKCELAPAQHILRFLRAIYAVLGWAVTSLSLLTVSGILKRFDGDSR